MCGKLLILGKAVDSTLLTPISAIAAQSANPTEEMMKQMMQMLDYVATQEEAVITYNKSNMILAVHSDTSYLSEPKAQSRAGGHFFSSHDINNPPNNGAILSSAHIIKLAAYIIAGEAVYIRVLILDKWATNNLPHPYKQTTQWPTQ